MQKVSWWYWPCLFTWHWIGTLLGTRVLVSAHGAGKKTMNEQWFWIPPPIHLSQLPLIFEGIYVCEKWLNPDSVIELLYGLLCVLLSMNYKCLRWVMILLRFYLIPNDPFYSSQDPMFWLKNTTCTEAPASRFCFPRYQTLWYLCLNTVLKYPHGG